MSNYKHFRRLEAQGIDLVELLGGDRPLATPEFMEIMNTVGGTGEELYGDLLYLLTHRRYAAAEAKSLWNGIVKHKRKMTAALERDPGIRVAAFDYLVSVRKLIENARIVDRRDFDELLDFVSIDDLTQLFNRRFMRETYQREIRRARRYSKPLTALLIDIDNFKSINDSYGHDAGDKVLVSLARLLQEVCRETDTVGRWGGDELLVLLPETQKSDAFALAERIRRVVNDRNEVEAEGEPGVVPYSVSIGLATYPDDSQEASELLRLADEALYTSKSRGRDVVSIYDPSRKTSGE